VISSPEKSCLSADRPASAEASAHQPALDGIRGCAVLLVLAYDCLKLAPSSSPLTYLVRRIAASGWIGVDLFFVLSGFLITRILLQTRRQPGYWKNFLARRALRIFPLYYATLVMVFFILPGVLAFFPGESGLESTLQETKKDQLWYWCYAQNWLFALRQSWPAGGLLKHFWSLAIEEQFYLVWPLAVAWCSRRQLGWLCLSLATLSVCLRTSLLSAGMPSVVGFVMTLTRLDGLCLGAGMAVLLTSLELPIWLRRSGPWLAAGMLLLLGASDLIWGITRSEWFAAYSIGHTLTAITFAAVIGAAATAAPESWLTRVLSLRLLLTMGKYSYAVYVFHRFVYQGVLQLPWDSIPPAIRGWGIFLTTCTGCWVAAQVSWIILERPCLSFKKYFPSAQPAAIAGAASRSATRPASQAAEPECQEVLASSH